MLKAFSGCCAGIGGAISFAGFLSSSRWVALVTRAFATGALAADPYFLKEHPLLYEARERLVIEAMAQQLRLELHELQHNQICASIAASRDPDVLEKRWNSGTKHIRKWGAQAMPWLDWAADASMSWAQAKQLAAEWKRVWGDPKDPTVQKQIQRAVRKIRAGE